ncbi:MAG: BACON domain-containing protein [Acidobacteriota bacterium]
MRATNADGPILFQEGSSKAKTNGNGQNGSPGKELINYAITPQSKSFSATGGTGAINVMAEQRCAWQAVASEPWITITSVGVGIGNGTVAFSVAANAGRSGRKGAIIIAGKVFAVKQKGN